jgi:hypothetical protein
MELSGVPLIRALCYSVFVSTTKIPTEIISHFSGNGKSKFKASVDLVVC